MKQFFVLGVIMLTSGLLIGLYAPGAATLGAWFTAALLLAFGFLHCRLHAAEQSLQTRPAG
jgi:4-hydroxybenzoate polyprenyltransferase